MAIRKDRGGAAVDDILRGLEANEMVSKMEDYVQHGHTSTLEHCERVARMSCAIDRRLHLGSDTAALARGALLHDFYLYDWHDRDPSHRLHGFRHPARAAANAERCVGIGEKERQIILSHMWPLTITKIPRCREAWIVCLADKWCSLVETLRR